jgi:hypothetical protein
MISHIQRDSHSYLYRCLEKIRKSIEDRLKQSSAMFFLHFIGDPDTINSMKAELDAALSLFQVYFIDPVYVHDN